MDYISWLIRVIRATTQWDPVGDISGVIRATIVWDPAPTPAAKLTILATHVTTSYQKMQC